MPNGVLDSEEVEAPRVDPRWRIAGYVLGAALFAAAIGAVVTNQDTFTDAVASVRHASPWLIGAAIILPVANWLVVSVSVCVLTRAYGRVGLVEMGALIANAWMLNYLPMRPGMVGRITYHKLVNRIRVRDSARVVIYATAMTGISIAFLGSLALLLYDRAGPIVWCAALLLPGFVYLAGLPLTASRPMARRLLAAMLLRHIDMLIWTARYWIVFALVGVHLTMAGAVALAVVSQIALLVPFTGNGLGVREWFIGQTAVLLPIALGGDMAQGLAADLVNRAAELLVSIPAGLWGAWWLARRLSGGRVSAQRADMPAEVGNGRIDPADENGRIRI